MRDHLTMMFGPKACRTCGRTHYRGQCKAAAQQAEAPQVATPDEAAQRLEDLERLEAAFKKAAEIATVALYADEDGRRSALADIVRLWHGLPTVAEEVAREKSRHSPDAYATGGLQTFDEATKSWKSPPVL